MWLCGIAQSCHFCVYSGMSQLWNFPNVVTSLPLPNLPHPLQKKRYSRLWSLLSDQKLLHCIMWKGKHRVIWCFFRAKASLFYPDPEFLRCWLASRFSRNQSSMHTTTPSQPAQWWRDLCVENISLHCLTFAWGPQPWEPCCFLTSLEVASLSAALLLEMLDVWNTGT